VRTKMLCLGVVLVAAAIGVHAEEWTKTYPVSGKPDVRVDTGDGSIHVSSGNEGGVKATVSTCGWKIGRDDVRVEEHQSGNRIEIVVKIPPGPHFVVGCKSVSVELAVPKEVDLELHTKDGSIVAEGTKGTARLSSGDGRIDVRDVEGTINADTQDGNINVDGRFEVLNVRTGDGRIDAAARPGSRMTAGWSIRTRDGNISVRLPGDIAAELDARTSDGKINCEFSGPVTSGTEEDARSVRGKLNGGGPLLEIRTQDGRVDVLKE